MGGLWAEGLRACVNVLIHNVLRKASFYIVKANLLGSGMMPVAVWKVTVCAAMGLLAAGSHLNICSKTALRLNSYGMIKGVTLLHT